MYIINNKQFHEIYGAAKNGDEKAKAIIEKYSQGDDYDAVKRLVDDYYGHGKEEEPEQESEPEEKDEPEQKPGGDSITGVNQAKQAEDVLAGKAPEENLSPQPVDITELLDRETDGLIDDDEVEDMSFDEFMDKKKRDAERAKKNHDYFSAFDPEGKAAYLKKKEDDYGHSFDVRRKDIERNHRDIDGAISAYTQMVGDQPDDGIKTDMGVVDKAYGDIVGTVGKSHSFGRSWDEDDMNEVKEQLMALMKQYGRSNVIAALNILKGDNDAYRDHRNNCIDKAIKDHNGKWEELLN